MAKIKQFRFYKDESTNNAPAVRDWRYYCDDTSFRHFAPIYQLGIQTLPGTRVYLNQSTTPIIIGASGIYELDLNNTTAVLNSIRVEKTSMKTINDLENGFLIIDIVYGGEGSST